MLSNNLKLQCRLDYVARKVSRSIDVSNALSHIILVIIYKNKDVRIMTFSKFGVHTEPLFKNLNMLKLLDLYTVKILKLCFNLFDNNLPYQFNLSFQKLINFHLLSIC